MARILAIDYGKKRTGLAVTDMLRITANPLLTIETRNLMAWLENYFRTEQVDEVVIGHPTQMNGQESESLSCCLSCYTSGIFRRALYFGVGAPSHVSRGNEEERQAG